MRGASILDCFSIWAERNIQGYVQLVASARRRHHFYTGICERMRDMGMFFFVCLVSSQERLITVRNGRILIQKHLAWDS